MTPSPPRRAATAPAAARADTGAAPPARCWLMKSEPDEASIDDVLAMPGQRIAWFGVRNYQARNFMRDQMQIGDPVLFYHSSCAEPGIVGFARVASAPYPDDSQFDKRSKYYDAAASRDKPRWMLVDVQALTKIQTLGLAELRRHAALADMVVLRKGNRLSITPVTPAEWQFIHDHLAKPADSR